MRTRSTRQKRVILEELTRTRSHPTAAELHDAVRRRIPRVSLGTVYRVLQGLTGEAAVLKLEAGGTPARYDADTSPHHHVRCTDCGSVADLPPVWIPDLLATFGGVSGYELTGARIELTGICPRCQRRRGEG